MKQLREEQDLSIRHIRDVRTLVKEIYPTYFTLYFYSETRGIKDTLEFERELYKKNPPLSIEIIKYPKSKEVLLDLKDKETPEHVIVQSSTNKRLYSLLAHFRNGRTGYQWNNKFDRFRNLYLVYEELEMKREYKFTAIRHAISHPRLTQKVKDEIGILFSAEMIDLTKRRHVQILKKIHEELIDVTEQLLIKQLLSQISPATRRVGEFIII